MVGVALDGVTINYPFIDGDDFVATHWDEVDMCLGYTTDYNTYVYHTMSPCITQGSTS